MLHPRSPKGYLAFPLGGEQEHTPYRMALDLPDYESCRTPHILGGIVTKLLPERSPTQIFSVQRHLVYQKNVLPPRTTVGSQA